MHISLNWLNDYIPVRNIPVEEISKVLTNLGLEVEGVSHIEPFKGEVVVGKITAARAHPNADTLQVCEVDVGDSQCLTIVCGAPNARVGIYVAVAKVGSVLPGDFKIKPSKIRGEHSEGMLCSGKELGISEDGDGILELEQQGLVLGSSIYEVFPVRDTVIELSVTPNRADCLSYVGVARDIAAKLGLKLCIPAETQVNYGPDQVSVSVESFDDCPRFTALKLSNVSAVSSPLWLQKRLESSGVRPINLIVDISNYVMLEMGQPIHAYDARFVAGGFLGVRRAKDGEELTTLDGENRKLCSDDLVIADKEKVLGLAGVMGGASSEVRDDTTEIIVEAAQFNASRIRKTAKRFALHSEASHRFERGVDIHQLKAVQIRVAELLKSIGEELKLSGKLQINSSLSDIKLEDLPSLPRIALRLERVRQITGLSIISQNECIGYLEGLGFTLLDKTADRMLFEVPSWRLDIHSEIDLIEEIARLHGYDKIPYTLPMMEIGTLKEPAHIRFTDEVKLWMASQGFNETISFPFISEADLEDLGVDAKHPLSSTVELTNPLVEESRHLRTSLCFSLLKALQHNQRRGVTGSRLFEAGRSFHNLSKAWQHSEYPEFEANLEQGVHVHGKARDEDRAIERNKLAAIFDQPFQRKSWRQADDEAVDFYHAKGVVEGLLRDFGLQIETAYELVSNKALLPFLNPGASALVKADDQVLGFLGSLHPKTALALGMDYTRPPVVIELDLDLVHSLLTVKPSYTSGLVKFPPVSRDIALVLSENTQHSDILAATKAFNRRKYLTDIHLFDVYRGKNLDEGKKSMAYHLSFQSDKKTLTDKEVDKELDALLTFFKEQLSADLR